ncbi:diguanylate cyclase/cyclic diguanylate phosphodiesterase [Klebsiella pneumoniae]|nr:diguanylate cyclase/cyclic diguanylate phosphodiesterase [Klebsiella pneumoniae]
MSQMVSEYMRLESRLAGMAIGAEGADHDEVRLRLEIMMSQIELLQEGDLGKFINKSEQRKTVVATLIRNLHLLDKQVDTMTPEQVRQILPVLSELDGPLTSMAAATLTQDINIVNITHDKIQHLYYIYSVISILLIAMCIGYADETSPEPVETLTIEAGQFGVFPPEKWHCIEALSEDTVFNVDFYVDPKILIEG